MDKVKHQTVFSYFDRRSKNENLTTALLTWILDAKDVKSDRMKLKKAFLETPVEVADEKKKQSLIEFILYKEDDSSEETLSKLEAFTEEVINVEKYKPQKKQLKAKEKQLRVDILLKREEQNEEQNIVIIENKLFHELTGSQWGKYKTLLGFDGNNAQKGFENIKFVLLSFCNKQKIKKGYAGSIASEMFFPTFQNGKKANKKIAILTWSNIADRLKGIEKGLQDNLCKEISRYLARIAHYFNGFDKTNSKSLKESFKNLFNDLYEAGVPLDEYEYWDEEIGNNKFIYAASSCFYEEVNDEKNKLCHYLTIVNITKENSIDTRITWREKEDIKSEAKYYEWLKDKVEGFYLIKEIYEEEKLKEKMKPIKICDTFNSIYKKSDSFSGKSLLEFLSEEWNIEIEE
ncbi:MAG: hypothetical protein HQK84_07030 [Nitrospinae bacterium]|nr:hypothetical protein [Nitrospinota bacterium]